ncbi:MAG: hypothetical protein J0M13_12200 [Candidatus Accumulibacter sp.]|nr:hypothetical protein [Candidatus Accumulibacter necessarius]
MNSASATNSPWRTLLVSSSAVLLAACATGQGLGPADTVQSWLWRMEKGMRKPGEKLVSHPDVVWKERQCAKLQRPFVDIDLNEVLPPRVTAGDEFSHRMVYSMCPLRTGEVVIGDLSRRITLKGNTVFEDVSRRFELKPGKWQLDAFIGIPAAAPPGVYAVEVAFSGGTLQFQRSVSLVVINQK